MLSQLVSVWLLPFRLLNIEISLSGELVSSRMFMVASHQLVVFSLKVQEENHTSQTSHSEKSVHLPYTMLVCFQNWISKIG